ncbi:MAG: lysophospholipid acyltransferase family protein [Clostridiaceae bacterium]|nr:1-acyl-sn-glycerol-3-phosphate acyltransferase [Eubacteriales bacterium]
MPFKQKAERPGKPLYGSAVFLLKLYSFFRFGFVAPRGAKKLEEPFLAVCNHSSNFDFMFALLSLYPKRVSTLTAAFFYHNKYLAAVLRVFHCIPREQFRADAASVRKMLEITASGGSVLLFPEGEVSGTGRTDVFPESTARLIRRMGVNVYAVKLYGSYLARPKWAAFKRRGRVRAEVSPLLTAQEAKELAPNEIFERVREALSHDEYQWQELARIPFPSKKPAERLEHLLYKCPRCKAEFALSSADDRLFCAACGNAAHMDAYGFLLPEDEKSVIYRHISDWVEYQRACIREEAQQGGFTVEAEAELQLHLNPRSLAHTTVGEGVVRLSREILAYEGTRSGERVSLFFPLSSIFKLPFSSGENFEAPNPVEVIAFVPRDRRMISKFVLAVPVLKELITS